MRVFIAFLWFKRLRRINKRGHGDTVVPVVIPKNVVSKIKK